MKKPEGFKRCGVPSSAQRQYKRLTARNMRRLAKIAIRRGDEPIRKQPSFGHAW